MVSYQKIKMNNNIPELLSLRETSKLLKVHPNTLRLWDKKGILKAIRFGARKDRKYKKEDVLTLIEQRHQI